MRYFDFSTWHGVLTTLLGIALFTLIGVGIRLLVMFTIQQRRERMNRQINERLRTLIAAYKTLGGSFTGNLMVNPTHLKDLRRAGPSVANDQEAAPLNQAAGVAAGSERARRIRDEVEAALSDIILLGNERHVRLAERAARELVAGHPVDTQELVVSLRDYIREALDIGPIPPDISIPPQGPTRPSASGGRGRGASGKESGQGAGARGGGMGGSMGGGAGMGLGIGVAGEDSGSPDQRK